MKKITKTLTAGAAIVVVGVLGWQAFAQTPMHFGPRGMGPGFGGPAFMGHGFGGSGAMGPGAGGPAFMGSGFMGPAMMMGAGHDSSTIAQMSVIHELVINHDRITRTVTNLPNGTRTVTESDDPQIAQLIKDHVASMTQRVDARSDPGLPIESPALHAILKNGDKVRTKVETTAKGTIVTQTSSDPETVAALQSHAGEVSDLVAGGMAAVHTAMLRNGAGMMHAGVMPGIMQGAPFGGAGPRGR